MKSIFKNFVISMGLSSLVIPAAYSDSDTPFGPYTPETGSLLPTLIRDNSAQDDSRAGGARGIYLTGFRFFDPDGDIIRYNPTVVRGALSAQGNFTDAERRAELARLTTLETDAGPGAVLGDEVFREVTIDNAPQRKRELGIFRREKARRR